MQTQLREQVRRTKGKLNAICVTFDLDTMEGFKNRKRVHSFDLLLQSLANYQLQPLSPSINQDSEQVELVHGTHVCCYSHHRIQKFYTLIEGSFY